ncbi:DUF6493 family protein [Lentzea flaviverrucosa]|uniref:DUF7824 domain-containing protein n=1 Tax=Lentzea flaviverrucosa TaxID=200379 RepID=A0A1H9G2J6_9PSEU|nr:DUF6493 family protein [Lentzea flaviverrucosa]RDI35030.1 hypothetical protein DFR72_101780 [Lentzea flaviverrucosa]SEQ44336.1 hypothetical protein SAMN05216195_102437 [Lentzea flaviverrucosa]
MSFDRIQALIESDQLLALGEVLKSLTPEKRKERAADLVAYEKKRRVSDRNWEHHVALHIAGIGLLPNASTLTPWLVRYQIWWHRVSQENGTLEALDVLRHRNPAWLPDLVTRIATRMPAREPGRHDLLRIVLEFCGDNPPDTDGFLLAFMDYGGHTRWRPAFDALIPRMLEVVGAGAIFANTWQWPQFLTERADRQVLLDGCLARLQQGGSAREMEGFLALHKVLDVTLDETAEHARDYVAMLPDSRSPVATLAQDRLKALDEAGKLDFDLLADASRWVFGRTEKKLIRTQLTWLGKHAKSTPDEVVLTVAELFAHESDDLRGQAVKLIAKCQAKISDGTRTDLLVLAEQLPADLAAQLGAETVAEEVFELAPFTPRPWPDPIATLDELTGEVRALFGRTSGHVDPVTTEQIIEAVVRFTWQDREAVAKAFEPIYDKHPWIMNRRVEETYLDRSRSSHCWSMLIMIIGSVPVTEQDSARAWVEEIPSLEPGSVSRQLTRRLREIARGLGGSPRPLLVSTPTEMSGLLAPEVLLDRLVKAETDAWEPWPRDLVQAYHRLPRDTRPGDFASLTSNAGRLLREWLADLADPVVELVERTRQTRPGYVNPPPREKRLFVTLEPGLPEPDWFWFGYSEWEEMLECWPAVLPVQREVVAGHLVPHLAHRCSSKGSEGALLPALAEADGPIGVATHLALAYGLGAEGTVGRAHAVDALLVLAARDQLDGKALGEVIGLLLERGELALNRVVPCLRDAARSGATAQIWDLLTTTLPKTWSHNRVADLVELAVELAQRLRPGGTVEGLAEVAARKGSSKAAVQARRLVNALG